MATIYLESLPRGATRGQLLSLLEDIGGLARGRVGKIDLEGTRAAVEVPEAWAERLARQLNGFLLGDYRLRAWTGRQPAISGNDHFARLLHSNHTGQ